MMRVPILLALAGAGTWTAGCSSTSAWTPPASNTARVAAVAHLRCGVPPVSGPRVSGPGAATLALPGAPDGIATTPDGATSFVALQSGAPRVAVIANDAAGPRLLRTLAVPGTPSGMRVTPDGRHVLAASGDGAVVLDVAAARGRAGRTIAGELTAPHSIAGGGPGAAEIAVSRDSRYAFVTLEGAGRVAVFDLRAALAHPGAGYLGAVSVGSGALGIAASPDGRRLYEVSESARVPGHNRGALNVIDQRRAVHAPAHAVIATTSAPCAPVRVAVSPDGDTVWVTARDGDALLRFAAARLVGAPGRALTSVTGVGAHPLGLALVGGRVLVADADLGDPGSARSGVTVVSTGATPRRLAFLPSGRQADAIAAAAHGRALVTDSGSRQLQAIDLRDVP